MSLTLNTRVQVIPTGGPLGADVVGFDIRNMSKDDYRAVRQAWLEHLVLRIRGQDFDDDAHSEFCRGFGELEESPLKKFTGKHWFDKNPNMSVLSNVDLGDDKPKPSLGAGELVWHSDMSYIPEPPLGTFLHAFEVPPPEAGGDTLFLNMYVAYDSLSPAMKERIAPLKLKHESVHSSSLGIRPGRTAPDSDDPRDWPGEIHPLVRTHPETGRKALFLGRRINAYIMGLSLADSESLLDELWSHSDQPQFTWAQKWKVGDMVMWDNRCTLHRRGAFDTKQRRVMHRLVVKGDRPV